jgi:hypothetical protein
MRVFASTFAGLAIVAMASGCSIVVSMDGLSAGSDPDGGAPQNAPGSGPAVPGVVLGDAAAAPGSPSGSDGSAAPTSALPDSSVPSGPDGGSGGGGGGAGLDATGGPDTGPGVDATPPPPPPPPTACSKGHARVFVTSAMHDASFGGVSGADAVCTTRAGAGGLGGNWRAWLSDTTVPAVGHVYMSSGGYVLVDGTTVANSFAALVAGSLAHAINENETGAVVTDGQTEVWTGIDVTGALGNGGFCTDGSGHDWSSNSTSAGTPLVGHLDATDSTWSAAYLQVCDRTNVRLYCFETCP